MTKGLLVRRTGFYVLILSLLMIQSMRVLAVCNIPGGLSTTNITTSGATLNWSATAADSFLVRYNVSGTSIYFYKTVSSGSATSTTISGLYPFTSYSWMVHTFCSGGSSGGYQATPATFLSAAGSVSCLVPNNTATNSITPNSASLSWNASIGADTFMVRYAPHNTTTYIWIKIPGSHHSYTLSNLLPNTSYDWSVRCICASAPVQAYSLNNVFATLSTNCSIVDPYYFTSSSIGPSSALVGWRTVAGAVSYNVRYAIRYSNNWITVSSSSLSKNLSGLQSSQWYEFQVQTICSTGGSSWSSSGIFLTTASTLSLARGPYLQTSTPSSIYIRWRTGLPSDSKVSFGLASTNLSSNVSDATLTTEHIVQLTGLSANTKYYYSIGSSGSTLQGDTGNYFRTNPPVGSTGAIRIWGIGDFGVNSTAQNQVRDSYMNYPGSANTNVWLWVGDNAYSDGTDVEYTNSVFNKYPAQMKKWTIWPATGNHDLHTSNAANQSGPYFANFTLPKYAEAGGVASNTEAYYSYNYGNVHFICLESTDATFRATGGAMYNWLTSDLNANTQRWTIVYFHHPPYSKGSHNSDTDVEMIQMRTNIIPLLESHKVDLVLCGHSHAYERSMMLKGHYGNESTFTSSMAVNAGSGTYPASYTKSSPSFNGTVYVVCGVSGQHGGTTSGWPHNAMYSSSVSIYGSLVIDVLGDRLDCKMLTNTSSIYDQFTIQKSGTALQKIRDGEFDAATPAGDALQIFPNPLIEESTVRYLLDESSAVRMEIVDMTGRTLYTLFDGEQEKGEYEIKLSKSDAVLPGGIYFIRLIAGEKSYLKKFVVE